MKQSFDEAGGRGSAGLRTQNARAIHNAMKLRVKALCGMTAHPSAMEGVGEYLDAITTDPTEEAKARLVEKIRRARMGDTDCALELNALHVIAIDNMVRAQTNYLALYENLNLAPNEQVVYTHTHRHEVRVRSVGSDGYGFRRVKAVSANKRAYFDLHFVETDEVWYRLNDPNQGPEIAAMAAATVDLSRDMANHLDLLAFNGMKALIGPFITTGLPMDRTFFPHSRVLVANLPTTNAITTPGATPTSLFNFATIQAIMQYCAAWGGIFGKPLSPTGVIYVPSPDIMGLASEIVPTGLWNNQLADGILSNYRQFSYLGINWILVPDVTIPSGKCYPVLNAPVGTFFTKSSMDEEITTTSRKKNEEGRMIRKVVQFISDETQRPNALEVTYHT